MKSLKEFITEQNINLKNFAIVDAWDKLYNNLYKDYADALIVTDAGNYFILPINVATSDEILDSNQANVYEIPKKIKYMDELENGLVNGYIDIEELKKLN